MSIFEPPFIIMVFVLLVGIIIGLLLAEYLQRWQERKLACRRLEALLSARESKSEQQRWAYKNIVMHDASAALTRLKKAAGHTYGRQIDAFFREVNRAVDTLIDDAMRGSQ